MCVYGYCRISRKSQNIERQVRNIAAAYPTAHIVKEAFTGTKMEGRKELDKLLKVLKAGDTVVFDSVKPNPTIAVIIPAIASGKLPRINPNPPIAAPIPTIIIPKLLQVGSFK